MTAPGATAPDNSFVIGSGFGQDITEESADALIKSQAEDAFLTAADNFRQGILGGFADIPEAFEDFLDHLTEAVTGVIGGGLEDIQSWAATAGAAIDSVADALQEVIDNVLSSDLAVAIRNAVGTTINDFIASFLDAIDGATGGFFNLDDLADRFRTTETVANVAQATAAAAQAAVEEIISDKNQDNTQGISVVEKWTGLADGVDLPNFNAADANKIGVLGQAASWEPVGTSGSTGSSHVKHTTLFTGDDQEVSVVINNNLVSNLGWSLVYLRASNSGLTSCVAVRIFRDTIQLGKLVWNSAGNYTWTQYDYWDVAVRAGTSIRLRAVNNTYTVKVNGTQVISYTGSAAKGSGYLGSGLAFNRGTSLGLYESGPKITQFTASDLSLPATLGVGWDIFRNSTSATADLVGGANLVPSTTFSTVRKSANITVSNLAYGHVTIQKAGWYIINMRLGFTNASNTDDDFGKCLLYVMAPGGSTWDLALEAPQAAMADTNALSAGGTWIRYCEVGESLVPGFSWNKSTLEIPPQIVGDPVGSSTFFQGTLASS